MREAVEAARRFVAAETEFHLGELPTEQANPRTRGLAEQLQADVVAGIGQLQSVDRDLEQLLARDSVVAALGGLRKLMRETLRAGGRICFSGCGATGRLAILLEAAWRRYWRELAPAAAGHLPGLDRVVCSLMTGGDFALIRSVEGFEDHQEFGRQQVRELGLGRGDLLVGISEGGETSSVIGTIHQALDNGAAAAFVFNNPAEILSRRLERSRQVLTDSRVLVADLANGPMAVAGSTRMQATTSELLVVGAALELALADLWAQAGGAPEPGALADVAALQRDFTGLLDDLAAPEALAAMAELIATEAGIYAAGARVTYLADWALLDILTDTTERAPTFMLPPFRRSDDQVSPPSWAFVKNPRLDTPAAWRELLGRPARCLNWSTETYVQMQAERYCQHPPRLSESDILSFGIGYESDASRSERPGSLALRLLVGGEIAGVTAKGSAFAAGYARLSAPFARRWGLSIGPVRAAEAGVEKELHINCRLPRTALQLWEHLAVKLVMNTVSTATMGRLGRLRGNWMVHVETSNKKLIDRGTRLVAELTGLPYAQACEELHSTIFELNRNVTAGAERVSPVAWTLDRLAGRAVSPAR